MYGRALWARAACSRTLDMGLHLLKFRDTCSMVRCSEVAGSAQLTRSRWSFCDAAASEMAVEQAIPSSRVPHSRGDEVCNKNEYVLSVTTEARSGLAVENHYYTRHYGRFILNALMTISSGFFPFQFRESIIRDHT